MQTLLEKVAVMFSGGIDSTTVVARLLQAKKDVTLISFDDDSQFFNLREKPAIQRIAEYYRLNHKVQFIRIMQTDDIQNGDYIPGWKSIMLMSAMAYCDARKIPKLLLGYHAHNAQYSDDSEPVIQRIARLYNETYHTQIEVISPFLGMAKEEVTQMACDLGVPIHLTFSCSELTPGGGIHCGYCNGCNERQKSFKKIGKEDTAYYWPKQGEEDATSAGYEIKEVGPSDEITR